MHLPSLLLKSKNERFGKGDEITATSTTNSSQQCVLPEQEEEHQEDQNFESCYQLKGELGSGKYSTIRKAVKISTGETYAVKCIKRADLPLEAEVALQREIQILSVVNHPNIVKLHEVYTDPHFTYLVMEYVPGGELFDGLVTGTRYSEDECRLVMQQFLSAVDHLHENNIIHRGLKPEKILLAVEGPPISQIKISGFSDACFDNPKHIRGNGVANGNNLLDISNDSGTPPRCRGLKEITAENQTILGTRGYASPEMLLGLPYSNKVDMWSAGIIMHILLCCYPPFSDASPKALEEKIKSGCIVFHSKYWSKISDDAKDFISKMLVVDASNRIACKDALNHPWFSSK